jgi:hypothetical protein
MIKIEEARPEHVQAILEQWNALMDIHKKLDADFFDAAFLVAAFLGAAFFFTAPTFLPYIWANASFKEAPVFFLYSIAFLNLSFAIFCACVIVLY